MDSNPILNFLTGFTGFAGFIADLPDESLKTQSPSANKKYNPLPWILYSTDISIFEKEIFIWDNCCSIIITSVDPETASFGLGRRFRFFAILGIDTRSPALGGIAKMLPENFIGKSKSTISGWTLISIWC
jgi:hypothetical protein